MCPDRGDAIGIRNRINLHEDVSLIRFYAVDEGNALHVGEGLAVAYKGNLNGIIFGRIGLGTITPQGRGLFAEEDPAILLVRYTSLNLAA
ncbi:uncharacterized protein CLUP02_11795 [Colletotrichum lupini]|uniref:Uncharacterized protein n=1 Tax=Colletotrichum lupini TaxID=145971 RepID=A0A9Q8SZN2_9PEZI|nr:uncharacterized protein CLUP02_11795 [Colletotrichum lupini]UQC86295.1 hypothetical protein CLUP02_11795 [Colletotrichum lupini]